MFRLVFSQPEHAEGELRLLLPASMVARIDWSTLTKLPVSFVEVELSGKRADAAFTVMVGGRKLLLYLLLEHQSKSDPLMPFRLLVYMVKLWEDFLRDNPTAKRLPAIVPMVVHHSDAGWTSAMRFEDLLDVDAAMGEDLLSFLPCFSYLLDDLSGQRAEDLRQRVMTSVARLTLICMSRARLDPDFLPLLEGCAALLQDAAGTRNGVTLLASLVRYILSISDTRPEGVEQLFRQLGPKVEEAFMTGAQILRAEGEAKGKAEGEAKGKAEGKAEVVLKQLMLKFGPLSAEDVARVEQSHVEQLDALAERLITMSTLDEVFGR
jgi:predicted transposase YdaD